MSLRCSTSSAWFGTLAVCLGALALVTGCASGTDGEGDADVEGNVEIFSWWIKGGELEALEVVLGQYKDDYPRATVTNATVAYADKAREELRKRMVEGIPPDTFQANTGADLLNNWVFTNAKDDAESRVESLQEIALERGWLDAFEPEALEAATYEDKLWALPVNIHRINSLVIRADLFEKHDLKVPKSIEELYALCDRIMHDAAIQAEAPEGERMACLGLGNKWDWTLSQLTFEMILPSLTSASYYEQFWRGEKSGDSKEIIAAMEAALYLYCGGTDTSDCEATSYFNADMDAKDWDVGVLKVKEKKAMMAAMGDWAKGLLESEQQRPGIDFDVVPFPGSEATFVFTSDTFPLPKGARNRAGALALLETFASVEAQVAFNKLKGSIPARSVGELDMSQFDATSLRTLQDFRQAEKVLALSGLLGTTVMPSLASELKASMRRGSTEIIRNYVRANYDLIAK